MVWAVDTILYSQRGGGNFFHSFLFPERKKETPLTQESRSPEGTGAAGLKSENLTFARGKFLIIFIHHRIITIRGKISGQLSKLEKKKMKNVHSARQHCLNLLSKQDRSSYILSSYLPQRSRDGFIATRAFNLETSKIDETVGKAELVKLRFEFWKSVIQRSLNNNSKPLEEPISQLLYHAYTNDNISLSKRYLITLVQTRDTYMSNPPIRNTDAMCSYGEGTYSQLNYLMQEAMYSTTSQSILDLLNANEELTLKLEQIAAHIGQATGVTTFLRGVEFYAKRRNYVVLPVDLMTKHGVSQESVLQHFIKGKELPGKVSDVVFETATRANDHIISARTLLNEIKTEMGGKLPDSFIVPALTAIPVSLYLERLEKCQFDLTNKSLSKPEWKLPYRSYKSYKLQSI